MLKNNKARDNFSVEINFVVKGDHRKYYAKGDNSK